MKQKKKLFNLRLFFIGFLGMILGILTFYHLLNILWLNKMTMWFVLFVVLFVANIGLIVLFSILKNYRKYLKYVIVFILLFVLGSALFYIQIDKMSNLRSYDDAVEIEGDVSRYGYSNTGYIIDLKNVIVNNSDSIGELRLYIVLDGPVSEELSLGDKVKVKTELTLQSLVTDKIEISKYVSGIVYSSCVINSDILVINEQPTFIESIQEKLKSTLNAGLSNENASIAYSVLVGDKSDLNADVKDTFSYAGISHILAVSGLHVGFLVAIITFILNMCRVGRRSRFFITSAILLLYCTICGFTASVLRASFMAIILLLAGVVGKEYDGLNSLGLAGILILLIFPQDLFSMGFQLSFMCVFMIITLADKMSNLLKSWKVPEFIASAISISLCVTLGSSIILINSLYEVSIISIVANLIVIPIFSITYPLLFLLAIVSMIMPFLNFALVLPEILLHLVKLIANLFANINFAHFRVFHLGYLLLFLFVLLSLIVKFFMGGKVIKISLSLTLAVICVALVVVGCFPREFKEYALYTNFQYNSNSALLTTEDNKKYLVGIDKYSTNDFLTNLKIEKLDALILPNFEVNKIDDYIEFINTIKVDKLVIPTNPSFEDKVFYELNAITKVEIVDSFDGDIDLEFIKTDENVVCGTRICVNGKKLLFTNGITKAKLSRLGEFDYEYDYIITNESKYDFEEYYVFYDTIIHSNDLKFVPNDAISLKNKSFYMLKL